MGGNTNLVLDQRVLVAARRLHCSVPPCVAVSRPRRRTPRRAREDLHQLLAHLPCSLVVAVLAITPQESGLRLTRCVSPLPADTAGSPVSRSPAGQCRGLAATRPWRAAGIGAAPNLEGEPAGLCGRMGVGDTSWPSRRRCAMVRGRVRAVSDPSRRRPCADGHVLLQTTLTPSPLASL